jgi:hypothetical protein
VTLWLFFAAGAVGANGERNWTGAAEILAVKAPSRQVVRRYLGIGIL